MNTWPQPIPPTPNSIPASVLPLESPAVAQQLGTTRKKILVVDDSVVIRKLLATKLTACGYEVIQAADGAGAVSTARKEKLDLILLDLVFPPDVAHGGGVAWDGFLIMEWMRRMEEAKGVPVIIITGAEPEKNRARCMAAGARAFFRKPINNDELLAAIRHTFGEDSTTPDGQAA